jgi:hypothetical protein
MRSFALSGAIVLLLAPLISTQERDALKAAAEALSVDHIKTPQVIASGATFTVGQNFTPSDPWAARYSQTLYGSDQLRNRQYAARITSRNGQDDAAGWRRENRNRRGVAH